MIRNLIILFHTSRMIRTIRSVIRDYEAVGEPVDCEIIDCHDWCVEVYNHTKLRFMEPKTPIIDKLYREEMGV